MGTQVAPRHFSPGANLPDAGMPSDRAARIAARQAFVMLKRTFLHALEAADGADWLRNQVRSAEEPVDLWLLRAPVYAALAGTDEDHRSRRKILRRGLDTIFPDLEPASAFTPL
jgi:hypothetical protein